MRLLTACEWVRAACGPRRHPWPWGYSSQSSTANTLDLDLKRPVATGTFEQSKSPQSICDLLGNVWEWVDPPIRVSADVVDTNAWAMGGSYLSQPRRSIELVEEFDPAARRQVQRWAFHEQALHPATRSSDVGLRCAADAEEYLWRNASRLDSADPARLAEIGRAWGRASLPLLEELAARPSAPRSLARLSDGARQ
jgi:formylglycine-generating enzyme required for sulfatase activity